MKIISEAIAEPITRALAYKQCKIDPEGSPPAHEDDDLLDIYISAAREWCEAYLGLRIAPTQVQIALDDFPTAEIVLEGGPVLAVASIAYLDADGAEQVVDVATYELDTTAQVAVIRLLAHETWPKSDGTNNNVKIDYSIGYSLPADSPQDATLPRSMKAAMLLLIAHLYRNRESTVEKALSEMPMGVRFLLSPFKLRRGFA